MTLKTKYNVKDRVYILELKLIGKIIGIYYDGAEITYNTSYFYNSEKKTCYFDESEINLDIPERKTGFLDE